MYDEDSIAVSLYGNMIVEPGEIHIITKEYSIRTKDPNNHSDTETGTLSSMMVHITHIKSKNMTITRIKRLSESTQII